MTNRKSSEAAASDRQGMLGASSRRKPPGDAIPVAASSLHAGNHGMSFIGYPLLAMTIDSSNDSDA